MTLPASPSGSIFAQLLDDELFLNGQILDLLGPTVGRRETIGRAQEHAHRLLEQFLWSSDSLGRVLLPGSSEEIRRTVEAPEIAALARLAAAPAAGGMLPRTAAATQKTASDPWRFVAEVLAAFYSDLTEAAESLAAGNWIEVEGPRGLESSAYTSGRRPLVLAAADRLQKTRGLFQSALVHGSYATLDELPGISDLDLLLVLTSETAGDPSALLTARQEVGTLWPILQEVDPLQHHGPFALTPADLAFYPSTFFPLPLLALSRSLAGPITPWRLRLRPTGLTRRVTLFRAAQFLRHPFPNNLYRLKMHMQVALLAPAFGLQAAGRFRYKRDTFLPFEQVAPPAARRAVTLASDARDQNWFGPHLLGLSPLTAGLVADGCDARLGAAIFQRALEREVSGSLARVLSPAAETDRMALADWLESRCPEITDTDLWDEEQPLAGTATDRPSSLSSPPAAGEDPWLLVANRYVQNLGAPGLVEAAWALGSRQHVSGSDLDLVLIVDPARAPQFTWDKAYTTWDRLSDADKQVMVHPPSAILDRSLAEKLGQLFPVFRCSGLFGRPPEDQHWSIRSPGQALGLLADYLMAQYPGEFIEFQQAGAEKAVSALGRIGAIRHALTLARRAGIAVDPSWDNLAQEALALRDAAAGSPHRIPLTGLLPAAAVVACELNERVAGLVRNLGFSIPSGSSTVVGMIGERVVLVREHNPELARELSQRYLRQLGSGPVNVAPVELAWGFIWAALKFPAVNSLYAKFVRLDFDARTVPPPPPEWQTRWEAVGAHAQQLARWRCRFGFLFPNHLHIDPAALYRPD